MGTFQDLTNKQSGTLVAERYLGKSMWLCKCQKCGNEVTITTAWFNKNIELSRDGCKHAKKIKIGDQYGYLTVIGEASDYIKPQSKAHEKRWKCQCICGRSKDILESNLKSLKSTSCGLCKNRISIPEKMIYYYLKKYFDDIRENYRPDWLNGTEIDIYLPSINVGIEYDGERWHQNIEKDIEKDIIANNHGVFLIRVREPNCPLLTSSSKCIITPKPTTNGTHMTKPIIEIIDILNYKLGFNIIADIDCTRDNADACKEIINSSGFNSLQLLFPEIAKEWDYEKNALSIVRSFMEEKPENLMSQWKSAPTGVDEQATILLQNDKNQMATVALTIHSKQPKRVMISCEKGYIEIMEFPRADKAIITEALTGEKREISAGNTADALYYELTDMETAINSGDASVMKLQYSIDVMDIMTRLRNEWGLKYPEEE